MKRIMIALATARLLLGACAASTQALALPPLPSGELPDTEVVTNVALNIRYDRLTRFSFSVNTTGVVSNEVLLAVGCDADENGDLSLDETAFVYGIENGERYIVDYQTGAMETGVGPKITIRARHFNPSWNMMKVVKRGEGAVGETVVVERELKFFAISLR